MHRYSLQTGTNFKADSLQADDELENPYLKGFEWDKDESWTRLIVHLQKQSSGTGNISKKKKKNHGDE